MARSVLYPARGVRAYQEVVQVCALNAFRCRPLVNTAHGKNDEITMIQNATTSSRNRDKQSCNPPQTTVVPQNPTLPREGPPASYADQAVCCLALDCVPFFLVA